jgi:DNA-binding NtrC family response regulator
MLKNFLVLGRYIDSDWLEILKDSLSPIGKFDVASGSEIKTKAEEGNYDLIIVDAVDSKEMIDLVTYLHKQNPLIPIVVVTISPTWQRARQFFLAGAVDYIQKSLNKKELLETFQTYLPSDTKSK